VIGAPPHVCQVQNVGADANLVAAVLLTENLRRPAWVRAIERAKGKLSAPGSYGVMQVMADKPISDRESIDRTIQGPLGAAHVGGSDGWDYDALGKALSVHNDNPRFIELARQIYYSVTPYTSTERSTPSPEDLTRQRAEAAVRIVRAVTNRFNEDRIVDVFATADIASLQDVARALALALQDHIGCTACR
jgi:hypothetical protein